MDYLETWCNEFIQLAFAMEQVPADRAQPLTTRYVWESFGQRKIIVNYDLSDATCRALTDFLKREDVTHWELDLRTVFDLDGGVLCLTPKGERLLKESAPDTASSKSFPGMFGMPWAKKLTIKNGIPLHERSPMLQTCEPEKFTLYDTGVASVKRVPAMFQQTTIFQESCLVGLAENRRNAISSGKRKYVVDLLRDTVQALQRDGGTKMVMVSSMAYSLSLLVLALLQN